MPKLTFSYYNEQAERVTKTVEAHPHESILSIALHHDIPLEHACEGACACATCHVIIRNGFGSLTACSEREEDMLDYAWGLEETSRLGCQTTVGLTDLVVEIPRYTLNQVSE